MYFLQKDDIMLHFTLSGSSDITGCQCLLFLFTWKVLRGLNLDLILESVAGFIYIAGTKTSLWQ